MRGKLDRPWFWGAAAALLVLLAQGSTVHLNYGGDWTALFVTGSDRQLPAHVPAPYRRAGTRGYDGQFYRVLAYDPLLERTAPDVFDAPRLRGRRILVPALARLLALGSDRWTDPAYIAVILLFVGLGVGWTAAYARSVGFPAAWGLAFLLLPATPVSAERLTVDVALAALCAGLAWSLRHERFGLACLFAALAPLVRETGLVLPAALALWNLSGKHWRNAVLAACAALPFLAWAVHVEMSLPSDGVRFTSIMPLAGLIGRSLQWYATEGSGFNYELSTALDYLALLGVWVGLALTARVAIEPTRGPLEIGILLFAVFPLFLTYPGIWAEAYAFARVFSPWLLWLGLRSLPTGRLLWLAPALCAMPRILAQLGTHLSRQ